MNFVPEKPKDGGPPQSAEGDEDDDEMGTGNNSTRLKTYIKPRIPTTQEVLDRRARKNAQSRARAAKLRQRIAAIEQKPPSERTEEEVYIWSQYETRRQRKNDRSRERALEKKEEIDRILARPDGKRSKIEKQLDELKCADVLENYDPEEKDREAKQVISVYDTCQDL